MHITLAQRAKAWAVFLCFLACVVGVIALFMGHSPGQSQMSKDLTLCSEAGVSVNDCLATNSRYDRYMSK